MNKEKQLLYLGEPLVSTKIGICQHDPFITNMLGYVHHCLHVIANLLKKVVVMTFKGESQSRQRSFFLIGFEHRRGFSKKMFGNPELERQGSDLKWLVKNIRWHMAKYAENLNVYEDVLDDLTGFLFDTVVKCYLGSVYLNDIQSDPEILNDCIEVGQELASAIEESEYYQNLKTDAAETKQDLEFLQKIVTEYQMFKSEFTEPSNYLDSKKALDFVENVIVRLLKKECLSSSSGDSARPITHHILASLSSRLKFNSEDSGIVCDLDNVLTTPMGTPSPKRVSSSTPFYSTPNNETPGKSVKIDNSMVIVDTPVIRNKVLEQVKNTPRIVSKQRRTSPEGEEMDGSFVLI